jgi:hypothetical protein
MVLLQPSRSEWEELELAEDPARFILELPWSRRVVLTLVAGRTVYRKGEFPTLPPLPMSISEAREQVLGRASELPVNPLQK